jgi:MerR family transcriptional regulator, light-induced transcriptional regulator
LVDASHSLIRIGELSRRLGISTDRLRAWERRYDLLHPVRTPGGFRLYSVADERRVRAMQRHLAAGLSAAEAAAAAADEPGSRDEGDSPAVLREQLEQAFDVFDAARAHAVLDRLFAGLSVEGAMRTVLFPLLHDVGERWARGEIQIGQEHFTSGLLQARLLPQLRGSLPAAGPAALLACAPGELHTLPLIGFGIALYRRGWRTTYLGADTPVHSLMDTAHRVTPAVVVVSAAMSERFAGSADELRELGREFSVAIAGTGATQALADRIGARFLDGDPVGAAATLTARDDRRG